ncbi:hypothetical protein [Enterococcus raffinosus]|jgi:hypothetical protein|uniref:hypothetical protein n=1 Tax=Enterococcus raffinosus TaxID=71452 RepID=UPI003AD3D84E
MIINTENVETILNSMTSREISELTEIPERTIQKYKSGELNWLGKNSATLGQLAEEITQMQFLVNVNDGRVIKATEYIDMLIREAVEAWNDLDEEEKKEDFNNSFIQFYESHSQTDSDFDMSDKEGNILQAEDQHWNEYIKSYQSDQLIKQIQVNN